MCRHTISEMKTASTGEFDIGEGVALLEIGVGMHPA
jgi:hypothetical protein